jgi:exo-beta-1,3-glucanase (GH17 family)
MEGDTSTKQIWLLLGVTGLAVSLYGQVSTRRSYQELKEENEELHSQLDEIHSEAEDAQSELATLKSDIDDVQTYASECDDCDEVQSAASDLDGPAQNIWKLLRRSPNNDVGASRQEEMYERNDDVRLLSHGTARANFVGG